MKKYNYSDNFDMLTIRQEFLQDVGHVEEDYIVEFIKIAHITAGLMFDKYKHSYYSASFDINDIKSLAKIYLVGYLGRYGFRYSEDSKGKFVAKFTNTKKRMPTEKELKRAERTQVITFIRQKLHHCATVCIRKSKNIKVTENKCKYYAMTEESLPIANPLVLLDDHKKYNYRPVIIREFKEARKKAKQNRQSIITDENGFQIVKSQFLDPGLNTTEYLMLLDRYDTIYTSNPESYLMKMEERQQDEKNASFFNTIPQERKISTLNKFIKKNKGNVSLKEEIKYARQLLKRHSFWYGNK